MIEQPETTQVRRRRRTLWASAKTIGVAASALAAALGSYQASHEKASAGYAQLVQALEETQKGLAEHVERDKRRDEAAAKTAERLARIEGIELGRRGAAAAAPRAPAPIQAANPPFKPRAIPQKLDDAWQMQKTAPPAVEAK